MTGVLQVLALVVIACVATFLLERGGRVGYGWITGSEFLVAGLLLGPVGLDMVSADLLRDSEVVVVLSCAWLGLRLGLRVRRSELHRLGRRPVLASQLESLLTLLLFRGLLELARNYWGLPESGWVAWLLAGLGAGTTKSAVAWVRSRHRAAGALTDALGAISELDDVVGLAAVGALLAFRGSPAAPPLAHPLWPLTVMLGLALAIAVLLRLVTGGGRLRSDLAWVALFGGCAVAAGAAPALSLNPLVLSWLMGALFGWLSPQGDAFEEMTRSTERPAMQVLLVLAGASLKINTAAMVAGGLFALLRLPAKVLAGAVTGMVLRPGGARRASLGVGLMAGGGMMFALAYLVSLSMPAELATTVISFATGLVLLGDFVGSPALKWLLKQAGEIPGPSEREAEALDDGHGVPS